MELKDWLPLAISVLTLFITGFLGAWQRRQSHRLDAIATAYKADIELYRGAREAADTSYRAMIDRKLTHIQEAIVKVQRLKNAAANLIEAAARPDTFPRTATVMEFGAAAEAVEEAHGILTQWFTLPEMLPLHRCKTDSATLSALVSAQVEGIERITMVPDSLVLALRNCRELASRAQGQLRSLATANQGLLHEIADHAPRPLG